MVCSYSWKHPLVLSKKALLCTKGSRIIHELRWTFIYAVSWKQEGTNIWSDFLFERSRPICLRRGEGGSSSGSVVAVASCSLTDFSWRSHGRTFRDVLSVTVVENSLQQKEFGGRAEWFFCFVSSMLLSALPLGLRLENSKECVDTASGQPSSKLLSLGLLRLVERQWLGSSPT